MAGSSGRLGWLLRLSVEQSIPGSAVRRHGWLVARCFGCEVGWLLRRSVVLSVEVQSFGRAASWYRYLGCMVVQSVVGSVVLL